MIFLRHFTHNSNNGGYYLPFTRLSHTQQCGLYEKSKLDSFFRPFILATPRTDSANQYRAGGVGQTMNMMDAVIVPMHPEGRKFVAIFGAVALVLGLISEALFWIGVGLTVWCYYFFRNPARVVPQGENLIICPADGVVSLIQDVTPPVEMGLGDQPLTRVSVFMNVFNCHVNRACIEGTVTNVTYHHGKFLNASLDKASEHNERNSITITRDDGTAIGITQIAGLVARRIVCFVKEGDSLSAGERFGLIRFGSRLDIYLPEGVAPAVCLGQTTVAGETILAALDTSVARVGVSK